MKCNRMQTVLLYVVVSQVFGPWRHTKFKTFVNDNINKNSIHLTYSFYLFGSIKPNLIYRETPRSM